MGKTLVSVIIPTYNGLEHLKKCLTSLYKQEYKQIEVIVVDNNSSDQSVSYIKKNFPQVKLVESKENLGFAESNNIGFDKSIGEYILLLNNDTLVTAKFLTNLVSTINSQEDIGAVQPKIFFMDNPELLDSTGSFLTGTGLLYHVGINRKNFDIYNHKKFIYSAKGACLLIKRSVLRASLLDGKVFDTTYFAYFEETDLCHRIWLSGYKVLYEPKSVIFHKMGATSTMLQNSFIQFHSFKNRINTYLKNLSYRKMILILLINILISNVYAILALLKLNLSLALSIYKAIWWNVVNIGQTIKKRKFVQQKIRKVSDDK
ncbi:glycosyltransferase family 2 protein, partial [Patescibacteria group bacterium]|nr:glycosyltransferase family 2 protein [Patescibacteria group bacterium]